MDKPIIDVAVRSLLGEARERLADAAAIVNAADAAADRGAIGRAIEIANAIDEPVAEAGLLLGAAAVLVRTEEEA